MPPPGALLISLPIWARTRGHLETCRWKSAMPLPGADEGMALFPQPQLLQGYANADLQKLNAARWICFNPRWPAAHGRSSPTTGTTSSQASYRLRRLFMLCIKSHLALTPLLLLSKSSPLRWASIWLYHTPLPKQAAPPLGDAACFLQFAV